MDINFSIIAYMVERLEIIEFGDKNADLHGYEIRVDGKLLATVMGNAELPALSIKHLE